MTKSALSFAIALSALTVGCASSANLVRKDALGGSVSLQGAYMPSMARARLLMAEHCQGPAEVLELSGRLEFHCLGRMPAAAHEQLAATQAGSAF